MAHLLLSSMPTTRLRQGLRWGQQKRDLVEQDPVNGRGSIPHRSQIILFYQWGCRPLTPLPPFGACSSSHYPSPVAPDVLIPPTPQDCDDCDECNCTGAQSNRRFTCCGLGSFVVFIVLFALSWDTLEPTEYGLVQNGFTGYVDLNPEHVYTGGRYFVWLRHYFLPFPRNLRNLDFAEGGFRRPIPARTGPDPDDRESGGQPVTLSISFQYRLQQRSVPKIYQTFGLEWESSYMRFVSPRPPARHTRRHGSVHLPHAPSSDRSLSPPLHWWGSCLGAAMLTARLCPPALSPLQVCTAGHHEQCAAVHTEDVLG